MMAPPVLGLITCCSGLAVDVGDEAGVAAGSCVSGEFAADSGAGPAGEGHLGEPATQGCATVSAFLFTAEGLAAGVLLEGTLATTSVLPAEGALPLPSI